MVLGIKIASRYVFNDYIMLYLENKVLIREHRYVMAQHLGRELLKNEVVHHIDGNKQNNSITNLQVLKRSAHSRMHQDSKHRCMVELECAYCKTMFKREKRNVDSKIFKGQHNFYCNKLCMKKAFTKASD